MGDVDEDTIAEFLSIAGEVIADVRRKKALSGEATEKAERASA
jgi:hypothetical protein